MGSKKVVESPTKFNSVKANAEEDLNESGESRYGREDFKCFVMHEADFQLEDEGIAEMPNSSDLKLLGSKN